MVPPNKTRFPGCTQALGFARVCLPAAFTLFLADAPAAQKGDWDPIPAKAPEEKDRHTAFHEKVAEGPHMEVGALTYFGGPDDETFVAAGELPDGRIVAFGTAYGPEFPSTPPPAVIGKGKHRGLSEPTKKGANPDANPDAAGFIVMYEPTLAKQIGVVRFDWGVASLRTGRVTADGKGLLLAGRCTEEFRDLENREGKPFQVHNAGSNSYRYDGTQCSGDVFVARMGLDGQFDWAVVLEGAGNPPDELWEDQNGNVYFDANGLSRVSSDGTNFKKLNDRTTKDAVAWHAVDSEGNSYFGGDRNTHTNVEPWRQPYLYKFDPNGKKMWTLWETNPKEIGADGGGLQSDSSIQDVAFLPDGTLVTAGWSDGANSVFQRLATDWKRNCPKLGFIDPWYPNGAQGFGHLNLIDPESLATKGHVWWVSYLPADFGKRMNRTNNATIRKILPLDDGSIAWAGSAATGMIQTPNSFYKYPGTGKMSGATVGVYKPDFENLWFSSYVPGADDLRLSHGGNGVLVSGSWRPAKELDVTPSAAAPGASPKPIGRSDGLLFLLAKPNQPVP